VSQHVVPEIHIGLGLVGEAVAACVHHDRAGERLVHELDRGTALWAISTGRPTLLGEPEDAPSMPWCFCRQSALC
jgi:hypothetical protein